MFPVIRTRDIPKLNRSNIDDWRIKFDRFPGVRNFGTDREAEINTTNKT
jgi:hypothetical protein